MEKFFDNHLITTTKMFTKAIILRIYIDEDIPFYPNCFLYQGLRFDKCYSFEFEKATDEFDAVCSPKQKKQLVFP